LSSVSASTAHGCRVLANGSAGRFGRNTSGLIAEPVPQLCGGLDGRDERHSAWLCSPAACSGRHSDLSWLAPTSPMSESLTQKWLRQNVGSYANSDRVYSDIDASLLRFATLRPKRDIYTYDDGRTQLLLCVHGLVPISYRNASYNIPIAVWITRDYPKEPPIAYVVPTSDMLVKAGRYVDVSGKCNIEYIQNWARKSEVSSVFCSVCLWLTPLRGAIYLDCSTRCSITSQKSHRCMPNLEIHYLSRGQAAADQPLLI
jgi:hypothetical protein